MVRIYVNRSKDKALEHKMYGYSNKRLERIMVKGKPIERRVARRIYKWDIIGKHLRTKKKR